VHPRTPLIAAALRNTRRRCGRRARSTPRRRAPATPSLRRTVRRCARPPRRRTPRRSARARCARRDQRGDERLPRRPKRSRWPSSSTVDRRPGPARPRGARRSGPTARGTEG
jgi:hypothetical protein